MGITLETIECFDDFTISTDKEVDLLVRWVGRGDDDRTWEPLEELCKDVPDLVAQYMKTKKKNSKLVKVYRDVLKAIEHADTDTRSTQPVSDTEQFYVNDVVEARWREDDDHYGEWYQGVIVSLNNE